MDTIGTFEAKIHLTRLLDRVAAGEQIKIARHGNPIARLVPVLATGSRELREAITKLKEFSKGQTLDGRKGKDFRMSFDREGLRWCNPVAAARGSVVVGCCRDLCWNSMARSPVGRRYGVKQPGQSAR